MRWRRGSPPTVGGPDVPRLRLPSSHPPRSTPTGHGGLAHSLDEHGVPSAPGPGGGPPPGVDPGTWQRAMQVGVRRSRPAPRANSASLPHRWRAAAAAGERAVLAQPVDDPRHTTGQRTALVQHDPDCLDMAESHFGIGRPWFRREVRWPPRTRSAGPPPTHRFRRCSTPSWHRRWCCRPRPARCRPALAAAAWLVVPRACAPSRSDVNASSDFAPAAGDVLTVTTAWLTSKYGEEKSTAAFRGSVMENSERLASKAFGPGASAALKGTRTQRTSWRK